MDHDLEEEVEQHDNQLKSPKKRASKKKKKVLKKKVYNEGGEETGEVKPGKKKSAKNSNLTANVDKAGNRTANEPGAHKASKKHSSFIPKKLEGDSIGDFRLMDNIGKGGFGTVYSGVNIKTGATVAIKRIPVRNINKEDLYAIKQEIRLLRCLTHQNIVKYIDAINTEDYLDIVLDFVENGSLSGLVSKFGGSFPESLVAHYIVQVLAGLEYLHQQGVIHRDIKGANILSTKDGTVKLADFGVATKLEDSAKSDSVVGTPYWMAPEIIEMTGSRTCACDIWSVGCTVIELLTGKPPYFDLQQMAALFRIVQDPHPPLPDDISPDAKDFLLQCFKKDPGQRPDAATLKKHRWLEQVGTSTKDHMEILDTPVPKPRVTEDMGPGRAIQVAQSLAAFEEEDDDAFMEIDDNLEMGMIFDAKMPDIVEATSGDWDDISEDGKDPREEMGDTAVNLQRNLKEKADIQKKIKHKICKFMQAELEEEVIKLSESIREVLMQTDDSTRSAVVLAVFDIHAVDLMEIFETKPAYAKEHLAKVFVSMFNYVATAQIDQLLQGLASLGWVEAMLQLAAPSHRDSAGNIVSHRDSARHSATAALSIGCINSTHLRNMFVACGGLRTIVMFCKEDYVRSRFPVLNTIDIAFKLLTDNSNDTSNNQKQRDRCCQLFLKYGIAAPLSRTLLALTEAESGTVRDKYVSAVCEIIFILATAEEGFVKTVCDDVTPHTTPITSFFNQDDVLTNIVRAIPCVGENSRAYLLKTIKALTKSNDPCVLDALEDAAAIPMLVTELERAACVDYKDDHGVYNAVIASLYYLCTIKQSRLDDAIMAGIVPHLKRMIRKNETTQLKRFALQIFFLLSKASDKTRIELKKHGVVRVYVDILNDANWRATALENIAKCLEKEPDRVGFVLNTSATINRLIRVFVETEHAYLSSIVQFYLRILGDCLVLNRAFAKSDTFLKSLAQAIENIKDNKDNGTRVELLKIVNVIHDRVPQENIPLMVMRLDQIFGAVLQKLTQENSADSAFVMEWAFNINQKLRLQQARSKRLTI